MSIEHDDHIGLRDYLDSNFENLNGKIDGVNLRLDKVNGKIGEHSSAIKILQDHDGDVLWLKRAVGGLVLTIVGAIIIAFATGKL